MSPTSGFVKFAYHRYTGIGLAGGFTLAGSVFEPGDNGSIGSFMV